MPSDTTSASQTSSVYVAELDHLSLRGRQRFDSPFRQFRRLLEWKRPTRARKANSSARRKAARNPARADGSPPRSLRANQKPSLCVVRRNAELIRPTNRHERNALANWLGLAPRTVFHGRGGNAQLREDGACGACDARASTWRPRGRPAPVDSRSNDRWFQHVAIVVSDMDGAYAALRSERVERASTGPQRLPDWNPNAGGIRAFYFRDPDRHVMEVLQFPPGKGEARRQARGRLFLGIGHTAIVVGDSDASLRFYRDLLGLRVAAPARTGARSRSI